MEWMILPLKRYADFSGRSRRKEYWMYTLFLVITVVVLSLIDSALGLGGRTTAGSNSAAGSFSYGIGVHGGVLTGLFVLATLIPSLAVAVRRLHDTNRSGWWLLAPFLPYILGIVLILSAAMSANVALIAVGGILSFFAFIGFIVLLVWYCLSGTKGPNAYGDDPLGNTPEDLARTFE